MTYQKYTHDPYYKNKTNRKVHFSISSHIEDLIIRDDHFKINSVRHGVHKKLAREIIQLLERQYNVILVDDDGEEMIK